MAINDPNQSYSDFLATADKAWGPGGYQKYIQSSMQDPKSSLYGGMLDPNTQQMMTGLGWNGQAPAGSAWQKDQSGQYPVNQPQQPANPYLNAPVTLPGQQPVQQGPSNGMPANPYLPQMGQALTAQSNQNLAQNVLPMIGRNSVATGGYGGSRQGVAEGTAMGNAQTGLNQALSSMYGTAWNSDQERANAMNIASMNNATSRYGIDTNADVAKAGYANQYSIAGLNDATNRYGIGTTADTARYVNDANNVTNRYSTDVAGATANRNLDLQGQQQGYNQFWGNLSNQLGLGSAQTAIGNEQYNAGLNPLNAYSSLVNPYTGLNKTDTTTGPASGGGAAGALGGAMTAAQLYDLIFGKKP